MSTFAIAALAVVFVMVLGRILDSGRGGHPGRQFARALLIGFFEFLYAYPAHARHILSGGSLGRATIWERAEKPRTKNWLIAVAWLAFVVVGAFAGGSLADATFKGTPDAFVTKENAWWWGFFGGLAITAVLPLLGGLFIGVIVLATLLPVLLALAILKVARRLLPRAFTAATSPREAPFSYFGVLLAVIIVAIALTGD